MTIFVVSAVAAVQTSSTSPGVAAESPSGPVEQSILPIDTYRLERRLQRLPLLDSYHLTLEQIIQPVVFQIEESGGFSDVDAGKFSVYGDSWAWNRWSLDGIDISDAFDSGAAALHVPFLLIDKLALEYRETPGHGREQGLVLHTRDQPIGPVVRFHTGAFEMGGKWPLAGPIMDLLSGTHSHDRDIAPPKARRRFVDTFELGLAQSFTLGDYSLHLGLQSQQGQRRYLDFAPSGRLALTYDEAFSMHSIGLRLKPKRARWHAWLMAEHRTREHVFAERYHAWNETAALSKRTIAAGVVGTSWTAGLVFQDFTLTPVAPEAQRELLDPDGEALSPFFVAGHYRTVSLDLAGRRGPVYGRVTSRLITVAPSRTSWSLPLAMDGAPYGSWQFGASNTFQSFGDVRLGVFEHFDIGEAQLDADLFMLGTYALNASDHNGLSMADVGVKLAFTERIPSGDWHPFLTFARTPVPITSELARILDPRYLNAALTATDGRLFETRGGNTVRLDNLSPTDVYSASAGLRWELTPRTRLDVLGIFKAYRDTMQLNLDGDEGEFGHRSAEGVFFFHDGPTRYRLTNAARETPLSYGLHLQLDWRGVDRSFFVVGFSAFNAVGRPTFGNGPWANDLSAVTFEGANPNSRIDDLANLDSDRGFALKAALGYRIWSTLWGLATIRFRDGTPFSFFDRHYENGQLANTYHSKRGSPLKLDRPLAGPREDFHLNLDIGLCYDTRLLGSPASISLLATNLFDMGNEIQEVSNNEGKSGRVALESQIPRALFLRLNLGAR